MSDAYSANDEYLSQMNSLSKDGKNEEPNEDFMNEVKNNFSFIEKKKKSLPKKKTCYKRKKCWKIRFEKISKEG
jgi:hypothetical protein